MTDFDKHFSLDKIPTATSYLRPGFVLGKISDRARELSQPIVGQIDQLVLQFSANKEVVDQLNLLKKEYAERVEQAIRQGNGANQLIAAYSARLEEKLGEWKKNPPQLTESIAKEAKFLSSVEGSAKDPQNFKALISGCKQESQLGKFLMMGVEGAARGLQDLARRIYDAGVPRIAALVLIEKVCKIGWAIGKGIVAGLNTVVDNWRYTKKNNVDDLIDKLHKEIDKAAPKDDSDLKVSASSSRTNSSKP